jgi:hypothetical protein
MKIVQVIFLLFVIIMLSGCTTRTAYDSLRYNREMECQKLQGDQRQECLRRSGMSYDEYQHQLKEQPKDR